jgi:hypothetical protein
MKRITVKQIEKLCDKLHPDYTHIYRLAFKDGAEQGADAQLASCKKEQEQERQAIGEWLEGLSSPDWNDLPKLQKKFSEGKEALKQGTLPEGMVKKGDIDE